VPRIVAIVISVRAAFRDSGGRNAGTPSEIASTPVRATAPDEKARRISRIETLPRRAPLFVSSSSDSWFTGNASRLPVNSRKRPYPTSRPRAIMYMYVGPAKMRPDSLMPRRFPTVSSTMKKMQIGTRASSRSGNAEVMAATPADTDTATVRM
jgi:hypothetical protein